MEQEEPTTLGKRSEPEPEAIAGGDTSSKPKKCRSAERTCVHEVAVPNSYTSTKDESLHGTLSNPLHNGTMAKTYPFTLDPFQQVSIACLERNESVLVSAHTSAGKTAIAEYAVAMSFRDKQRVIYTSPLKALSNQKYRELSQEFKDVGLMTGDVTLSPNATCLVMTTEILRGMLYRGSEVLKEVAWVIFDEIHYMKDRERGVVWEESIIFLPPAIKMVFLSATMSNATEFAEWICNIHKQPCHVVYTDFRPTPLQHYVFPNGGSGLYLVVDENEQFREDNFVKLQDTFIKQKLSEGSKGGKPNGRGGRGGSASGGSDIYKIVKMIMERKFQPVIIFSFSRRECEQHAMAMSKLDFNTQEEKDTVEHVFRNAARNHTTQQNKSKKKKQHKTMSLVTEEIKSKSEVYHGDQLCQAKSKELLREIVLPNGLLPLKDIIEVGYNRETGFVWLKQKKSITHKFEKIGKLVSYATEVTAHVEKGKIKKLNGVKTKELLIWITLSDIYVDDPPTGKITFKTPAGLSRTFPVSAFEVEEEKSSVAVKESNNKVNETVAATAAGGVKEV